MNPTTNSASPLTDVSQTPESNPNQQLARELHVQGVAYYNKLAKDNPLATSEAIEMLEKSAGLAATPECLVHLAKMYMATGSYAKAIERASQCLHQFFPQSSFTQWTQDAQFLSHEFARQLYKQAQRILGQAHAQLAQYESAATHLRIVNSFSQSQLQPGQYASKEDMDNEFDLAYALLALGQYEQGWAHYRVRYQPGFDAKLDSLCAKMSTPRWGGNVMALEGSTVLLLPEQGYGDQIQFARCAKALKEAGARVWILASGPTLELMQTLPWQNRVMGEDFNDFEKVTFWSTALHASALLTISPYTQRVECPYLHANDIKRERFKRESATETLLAINWRGNATHINDRARSISLRQMMEEVSRHLSLRTSQLGAPPPKVRLLSIQMAPTELELEIMRDLGIRDMSGDIKDFSDMAGVLANVDHLLTIDSAPVHLAGAMNVPATLLVPPRIDWRWGCQPEAPPWYQSVQLRPQLRFG
jgi:tetratricopeptide (TPR) repeat protein